MRASQTMQPSSKAIPAENAVIFPVQEPRKIYEKGGFIMRTGLTKKQKVTEVYYNAKDPTAEVYTHDTKLKKRLLEYAAKFPELCQQTDDDEQGGLRFEIDKSRISIRLTAPYSEERKQAASQLAKQTKNLQ